MSNPLALKVGYKSHISCFPSLNVHSIIIDYFGETNGLKCQKMSGLGPVFHPFRGVFVALWRMFEGETWSSLRRTWPIWSFTRPWRRHRSPCWPAQWPDTGESETWSIHNITQLSQCTCLIYMYTCLIHTQMNKWINKYIYIYIHI